MWRCRRAGDPLERLNGVVNFEAFRYRLDKILKRRDRAQGGRPPSDCVLMFKVPVLQALDTLSDEQAEFQIRDRLSFLRFLGIGMCGKGPDATTIWLFREQLTEAGAMAKLLALFDTRLRESGYLAMSGQIIDASLIAAPRQRHTEAEKAAIRGLARVCGGDWDVRCRSGQRSPTRRNPGPVRRSSLSSPDRRDP